MKRISRLQAAILLFTILSSLFAPFLQPPTPAHAWSQQTWDTKAAFNAGVLTNVDTSSSPNNVLLATNLNTGDGSDGPLTVNDGGHLHHQHNCHCLEFNILYRQQLYRS